MTRLPTTRAEHQVRRFADGDVDDVKLLVYQTIHACYPAAYPKEAIEFFKQYHSEQHILQNARDGYTIVLEAHGNIIGTGTLLGTNVRRVFVHPRFQQKGFGKLIMRKLEERAAGQGIGVLDLSSSLVSKRFYDDLGYVTEKQDYIPVANGKRLIYYAMVKTLNDTVTITPVHSDNELEDIRSLFQEYAASLDFDLGFQGFQEELKSLPGDYAPPHGRLLLAVREGKAVGCVALRRLEGRVCEMKRLFIRPECRRMGIGRTLAEAAITEAKKLGYTWMRLDTTPKMKKAHRLYRSLGFTEIAPYYYNPIPGAVYFELKLDEMR